MTPAQRAILAKAKKDGMKPSEVAAEFGVHDLVEAQLAILRGISVAYKDLGEKGQDAAIHELTEKTRVAVIDMLRLFMANGVKAIPFTLKSLNIDGKLKVTGFVAGDCPERHALTDKAHDKSEILLILSPRDYFEGLETIQGEKDQKSLAIDPVEPETPPETTKGKTATKAKEPAPKGRAAQRTSDPKPTSAAALAAKAIQLTPKSVEDAKAFILNQQNTSLAGLQNHLKIGIDKAQAHLDRQVADGVIVLDENSETGYRIVREPAGVMVDETAEKGAPVDTSNLSFDGEPGEGGQTDLSGEKFGGDDEPVALTDELYEQIKAHVLKKGKVSSGTIMVTFSLGDDTVTQALERLELDGVITEENDMGIRSIIKAE
jgi:hypothetical protein